jgi:hypothetical protein
MVIPPFDPKTVTSNLVPKLVFGNPGNNMLIQSSKTKTDIITAMRRNPVNCSCPPPPPAKVISSLCYFAGVYQMGEV